jgi:hypothetical protein
VRITATEDGDEVEEDDEPVEWPHRGVAIPGDNFAEAFGFPLARVPFVEPGVFEFQLWADGFDEPISRERVEARV